MNIRIVTLCLLLTTLYASAQYNNNYGALRNNGVPQTNDSKPTAAQIEKEKNAQIAKIMDKLKTDLTLDDLQMIAIKNEILTSNKNTDILMKKEDISEEDKSKELKAIQEKTEKNILSYLNTSQKEKFQVLKEERAVGKNDKKKRKDKSNEKEVE